MKRGLLLLALFFLCPLLYAQGPYNFITAVNAASLPAGPPTAGSYVSCQVPSGCKAVTFSLNTSYVGQFHVYHSTGTGGVSGATARYDQVPDSSVTAVGSTTTGLAANAQGTFTCPIGSGTAFLVETSRTSGTPFATIMPGMQSAVMLAGGTVTSAPLADLVTTGSLTVQDTGSTATVQANGQTAYTGTPTAGSVLTLTGLNGQQGGVFQTTNTWTGTVQAERTYDNGVTWFASGGKVLGAAYETSSWTGNLTMVGSCTGATGMRLRVVAVMTGTCSSLLRATVGSLYTYTSNNLTSVLGSPIGASNPVSNDSRGTHQLNPPSSFASGTNWVISTGAKGIWLPTGGPYNLIITDSFGTVSVYTGVNNTYWVVPVSGAITIYASGNSATVNSITTTSTAPSAIVVSY